LQNATESDLMVPTTTAIPAREFNMSAIRLCILIHIVVMASFAVPMTQAHAQNYNASVGDQPGLIPNDADEEL
jgi:hypothetical protein